MPCLPTISNIYSQTFSSGYSWRWVVQHMDGLCKSGMEPAVQVDHCLYLSCSGAVPAPSLQCEAPNYKLVYKPQ